MDPVNLKKFLLKIWPYFYRIINTFFYFILSVFKSMVSIAVKQIKE